MRASVVERGGVKRRARLGRRGVTSVLAMMFLVLFGSLGVAMAIASRGNLRTAATHQEISRAMSAAESGLLVAELTLRDVVSRYMVDRGVVDETFGWALWRGSWSNDDGRVLILSRDRTEELDAVGVAYELAEVFNTDANMLRSVPGDRASTAVYTPTGDVDTSRFRGSHWVETPPIAILEPGVEAGGPAAAYKIRFVPLANGTDVRAIVWGYSTMSATGGGYFLAGRSEEGAARPVTRVVQQDFRLVKRHDHAILSPSRIMIGKNVQVNGNLGALYTDVSQNNGHPIVMRSDFYGLDAVLDQRLEAFYQNLLLYDVDGDNRLRVGHPIESQGLLLGVDADGDGVPDAADDVTGDGYVDEFDLFIQRFDSDGDGRVVLSAALTAGTPAEGRTPEFTLDDDLALLIDGAVPDRNNNGISGYIDVNGSGRWDPGEPILDEDPRNPGVYPDRELGWRDGFICAKDQYAKVRGRLRFRVRESDWTDAQGNYQQYVNGPIVPTDRSAPVRFDAAMDELPELTADSFDPDRMTPEATGSIPTFAEQVALELGVTPGEVATYLETSGDSTRPRYWRTDTNPGDVFIEPPMPLFEKMPFNAPAHAYVDWSNRPRYENMVFDNVTIPRGTNALFVNCTFVGITRIRTEVNNQHPMWNVYGRYDVANTGEAPRPMESLPGYAGLDKSDFVPYFAGESPADWPQVDFDALLPMPLNYASFLEPPTVGGQVRVGSERSTKQYSNNIRFHNCTFIGSIVTDSPRAYTHVRNKLQFTGGTRFLLEGVHPRSGEELRPDPRDLPKIVRSSIMAPNYSIDIGMFNSPTDTFVPRAGEVAPQAQDVRLSGTIVAGILDVRGNTTLDGTLLLTFKPELGQGPLVSPYDGTPIGNPANFNASIGYFGPEDGDEESLDPNRDLVEVDGRLIAGWDTTGDGIPDVGPQLAAPAPGAVPIPFYGYGRIELNWNPDIPMPDGILLPVKLDTLATTYREGTPE